MYIRIGTPISFEGVAGLCNKVMSILAPLLPHAKIHCDGTAIKGDGVVVKTDDWYITVSIPTIIAAGMESEAIESLEKFLNRIALGYDSYDYHWDLGDYDPMPPNNSYYELLGESEYHLTLEGERIEHSFLGGTRMLSAHEPCW